ncbi:gustatory receptor [Homalodisca vitripennis]|nr:gustatory receptor [Homalodisca vitripennis]
MTTILTEVISFYSYARKYTKFLDVCDTLERFDYRLQLTPSKRWITVKFTALIAVLTVTPISSVGFLLYQILNSGIDYEIFSRIIVTVCSMFAHFVHMCILAQFHEVTQCIATRFRLINARIRQEVIIQSYRQLMLRQYPQCIIRGQDGNSNNKIKAFMSAYQMIREAVHQVSVFYCDPFLSVNFYKFVHVTITLYTIFLYLVSENPVCIIKAVIWLMFHICYLLQIVSSSSDVTQAADETSPIICKLINKDLDTGLKRQLESFLLQLAVQNLEFSVKGIFNINRQMITIMAATVTTYLVILIQFQTQTTNYDSNLPLWREVYLLICKLITNNWDGGLKKQIESFLLQLVVQKLAFAARKCFKISRQFIRNYNGWNSDYLPGNSVSDPNIERLI